MDNLEILETKRKRLYAELSEIEDKIYSAKHSQALRKGKYSDIFSSIQTQRYSRHIILNDYGPIGQEALITSRFLIVGAGGLGCPAAQYLCAAGAGTIGLVDDDEVAISNLQRQVLFNESDVGISKVAAACAKLKKLNSSVNYKTYKTRLTRDNAVSIIGEYDIVLDCSDNVPTRYLVNDVCMLMKKPLIAGNAIRFNGSLSIHICGTTSCYRCLYPEPPHFACVQSCNEDGVIGPVVGVIGVMQALEAMKIAKWLKDNDEFKFKLTMFDGKNGAFKHFENRKPKVDCPVCKTDPDFDVSSLPDYELWCSAPCREPGPQYPPVQLVKEDERISVKELSAKEAGSYLVVDVRPRWEFEMCRLPNAYNLELPIIKNAINNKDSLTEFINEIDKLKAALKLDKVPVYTLCRCGNDSQTALKHLKDVLKSEDVDIKDVTGGLYAWNEFIDSEFPLY